MEEPFISEANNAVRIEEQGGALAARLVGVIDIAFAEELHRNCLDLADSGKDVVIELGEAERLDASALQVLLALRQELIRRGRSFSITGHRPEIRNYLEIAGIPQECQSV